MTTERKRFCAFPTGPNGFRKVDGRELNPKSPGDIPQARFDELVQVVNACGGSASFVAGGESEKPVTLTPAKRVNVQSKKSPKEEKLRRQQDNMAHFSGFRRGQYFKNGVPLKK